MASIYRDKRCGYWYISYSLRGRRVRKSLKTSDKELAEGHLALLRRQLKKDPHKFSGFPTLVDLQTHFRQFCETRAAKTNALYTARMQVFVDFAGKDHLLKDISGLFIDHFLKALSEKRELSRATLNGYRSCLRVAFNLAVKWGLAETNPVKGSTPIRPMPKHPPRFLSDDEVNRLLEAARKSYLYPLIAIGLYAGLRRQELEWLEWRDIDFSQGIIKVLNKAGHSTKTGKFRMVPLAKKLRDMLQGVKRRASWVCPNARGGQVQNNTLRNLQVLYQKADIEGANVHTLRHTFASRLASAGVSIYKISKWLGHSDVKTTMIYAHLEPQDGDINRI